MKRQLSIIIFGIALIFILSGECLAGNFGLEISRIKTPQALASWLAKNFSYAIESRDVWQSPQETLETKSGDCEDFAILAQDVLNKIGISSQIMVVRFKDSNLAHAICIWKNESGYYEFISNKELIRTTSPSIQGAISYYYPDWGQLALADSRKGHEKLIARND